MDLVKIVAIVLIAGGILGLARGGYTYSTKTHEAQIGSLDLSVNENRTVNIPIWASIGAIVLGGGLLLMGTRKQ
jgi:hypothetical protein